MEISNEFLKKKMGMEKAKGTLEIIAYLASLKSPMRELMFEIRSIILEVDEEITEALKWDTIVFHCNGDFATFRIVEGHVTLVFFHGMALKDKYKLLRKEADVKARSITFSTIEKINRKGLQDLVRQAIALNKKIISD